MIYSCIAMTKRVGARHLHNKASKAPANSRSFSTLSNRVWWANWDIFSPLPDNEVEKFMLFLKQKVYDSEDCKIIEVGRKKFREFVSQLPQGECKHCAIEALDRFLDQGRAVQSCQTLSSSSGIGSSFRVEPSGMITFVKERDFSQSLRRIEDGMLLNSKMINDLEDSSYLRSIERIKLTIEKRSALVDKESKIKQDFLNYRAVCQSYIKEVGLLRELKQEDGYNLVRAQWKLQLAQLLQYNYKSEKISREQRSLEVEFQEKKAAWELINRRSRAVTLEQQEEWSRYHTSFIEDHKELRSRTRNDLSYLLQSWDSLVQSYISSWQAAPQMPSDVEHKKKVQNFMHKEKDEMMQRHAIKSKDGTLKYDPEDMLAAAVFIKDRIREWLNGHADEFLEVERESNLYQMGSEPEIKDIESQLPVNELNGDTENSMAEDQLDNQCNGSGLVVDVDFEDNEDILSYIHDNLKENFTTIDVSMKSVGKERCGVDAELYAAWASIFGEESSAQLKGELGQLVLETENCPKEKEEAAKRLREVAKLDHSVCEKFFAVELGNLLLNWLLTHYCLKDLVHEFRNLAVERIAAQLVQDEEAEQAADRRKKLKEMEKLKESTSHRVSNYLATVDSEEEESKVEEKSDEPAKEEYVELKLLGPTEDGNTNSLKADDSTDVANLSVEADNENGSWEITSRRRGGSNRYSSRRAREVQGAKEGRKINLEEDAKNSTSGRKNISAKPTHNMVDGMVAGHNQVMRRATESAASSDSSISTEYPANKIARECNGESSARTNGTQIQNGDSAQFSQSGQKIQRIKDADSSHVELSNCESYQNSATQEVDCGYHIRKPISSNLEESSESPSIKSKSAYSSNGGFLNDNKLIGPNHVAVFITPPSSKFSITTSGFQDERNADIPISFMTNSLIDWPSHTASSLENSEEYTVFVTPMQRKSTAHQPSAHYAFGGSVVESFVPKDNESKTLYKDIKMAASVKNILHGDNRATNIGTMATRPSGQRQPSKLNVKAEEYRSILMAPESYRHPRIEPAPGFMQVPRVKKEDKAKNGEADKIITPDQSELQRKLLKDKISSISTDDMLTAHHSPLVHIFLEDLINKEVFNGLEKKDQNALIFCLPSGQSSGRFVPWSHIQKCFSDYQPAPQRLLKGGLFDKWTANNQQWRNTRVGEQILDHFEELMTLPGLDMHEWLSKLEDFTSLMTKP